MSMIKNNRQLVPNNKQPFSSPYVVYPSKNKSQPSRKPSLPVKRTLSVSSNHSCLSDRIIYSKDSNRKQIDTLNRVGENPIRRNNVSQNSYASNQSVNSTSNLPKPNVCFQVQKQKGMRDKKTFKTNMNGKKISDSSNLRVKKNPTPCLNQNSSQSNVIPANSIGLQVKCNKNDHFLTGFQWLIIMRHSYHLENKKRGSNYIKLRTLLSFLRNKMYPDSVWNKILVMPHEKKFTTSEIVQRLETSARNKLNLDDIFCFLAQGYMDENIDGQESAAQTARFMDQLKTNPDHHPKMHSQITHNKDEHSISKPKVIKGQVPKQMKIIVPINDSEIISHQMGLDISPISRIDQTSNNISFSMEDSSQQSQLSQSGPNKIDKNYYESTKIDYNTGRTQIDRFEAALHQLQMLKQKLKSSNLSEQKTALLYFLDELTTYSLYSVKKGKNDTSRSGLGSKKISLSSLNNLNSSIQQSHLYGIKLEGNQVTQNISTQILKRIFQSSEFIEYFQTFQAVKITNNFRNLFLFYPYLGNNIRILNLSHNQLRSTSFLKEMNTDNLQFINLNNNKLTNMGELLTIPKVVQIHLKNNLIDHVSSQKVLSLQLKLIDLSWNQIQKEEDLWALRNLQKLTMINLVGNAILTNFRSMGLLPPNALLDYPEVYIFSAYTQYKDVAFQTKNHSEAGKK